MHHLADSMTELRNSGKHNNALGERFAIYQSGGS